MDLSVIVAICIAIVSTIVTLLLRAMDKRDAKKKVDEQKLDLKISDKIAHYEGRFSVKIINDSENATVSGLNLSLSLENPIRGFVVNLKGAGTTPRLHSKKTTKGKPRGREILVKIDAMSINKSSIEKLSSDSLIRLYDRKELTLANLLLERGTSLFITGSVTNDLTGLSVVLPVIEYKYDDIVTGIFRDGSLEIIPQIQKIDD